MTAVYRRRPTSLVVDNRKTFGLVEEVNRRPVEPIFNVKKETLFTGGNEKVVTKTTTIITFRSPPSVVDQSKNQPSSKSATRPASVGAIKCAPHQPDLVTNSIQRTNTAQEINRLEALCEERTKELNVLKIQLKHATLGFDALSVMVQYLTHELDAFSCPTVTAELQDTKQKLEQALTELDTAKKERQQIDKDVEDLNTRHKKYVDTINGEYKDNLKQVEERLTQEKDGEVQRVIDQHSHEVTTLKNYHDKHVAEIQKDCMSKLDEKQKIHEDDLLKMKQEHSHAMEDFQQRHSDELMEITRRFEDIKVSLSHKVETLRLECEDLRAQAKHYQEALERDTDQKVQIALRPYKDLPQEIESLKMVIDMRNEEIRQLRQLNLEQGKQLEELPIARDRILALQQKIENLEAILDIRGDYEKQLSEKHQMLLRKYDKESKANKRLSMDNEELNYRLQFDPDSPDILRRQVSRSPPGSPGSPTVVHRRRSPSDWDKSPTHKSSPMRRSWHHLTDKKARRKSGSHLYDENSESVDPLSQSTCSDSGVLVFPSSDESLGIPEDHPMSKSCI